MKKCEWYHVLAVVCPRHILDHCGSAYLHADFWSAELTAVKDAEVGVPFVFWS